MIKMVESPFLDNRERVLESSVGFVIYDKYPVNEGHCLIIPHRVYSNYFDSSNEEIEGLNQLLFDTKKRTSDDTVFEATCALLTITAYCTYIQYFVFESLMSRSCCSSVKFLMTTT